MDIIEVKKELKHKLGDNITGIGIKGTGKSEYIIVYIKERSTESLIPATFKGFRVDVEIDPGGYFLFSNDSNVIK